MTEIDHSLRRLGTDYVDLYQIHRNDHVDPAGGDARGAARPRQGRQGPLPGRVLDARLGVRQGAAPAASARLGALRLDAGPLQPARPRGGARDAPAVRRRGRRHDRVEPAGPRPPARPWDELHGAHGDRRLATPTCSTRDEASDRAIVDAVGAVADARGVSRAQVALAWLRTNPVVVAPLVGASRAAHIDDAVASLDVDLTARRDRPPRAPLHAPHDFQGVSDEAELQRIIARVPGFQPVAR